MEINEQQYKVPDGKGGYTIRHFETSDKVVKMSDGKTLKETYEEIKDTITNALNEKVNKTVTLQTNLASTASTNLNGSSASIGVTGTLPASNGGTGQTSLQATRNAMGLGNTTGVLPVANGGTGTNNLANVSVGYATNANYANSAGTAATCTGTANYANSAGSATTATNANYATNATNATNANYSASTDISKVFYPISHESTEDFNNITTLGMHTILLTSDTPNKPPYIGRVFMAVVGRNTCIQQIVWNYAGGRMWIRGTNDTLPDWWTWQKVTLETVS